MSIRSYKPIRSQAVHRSPSDTKPLHTSTFRTQPAATSVPLRATDTSKVLPAPFSYPDPVSRGDGPVARRLEEIRQLEVRTVAQEAQRWRKRPPDTSAPQIRPSSARGARRVPARPASARPRGTGRDNSPEKKSQPREKI